MAHEPEVRRSAKIATVAAMMECDVTDIYRLIRSDELETHRKGKRGIRVFIDSVVRYQERQTIAPRQKAAQTAKVDRARAAASHKEHLRAVAGLRAKGLLP